MSVFNLGLFNGPRYSAFSWNHSNKISMKGGKIVPIAMDFLDTGESAKKINMSDVVRVAPMLAPTLDTYRVDVHAFAVRLRSIGHVARDPWKYEDFFNLNTNVSNSKSLPSIPIGLLFSVNGFRNGTLFESLGLPTFKALREEYFEFLRNTCPWVFDPIAKHFVFSETYILALRQYILPSSIPLREAAGDDPGTVEIYLNDSFWNKFSIYFGSEVGNVGFYRACGSYTGGYIPYRGTLVDFIFSKYPSALAVWSGAEFAKDDLGVYITNPTDITTSVYEGDITANLLDEVYKYYKVDSISVLREFEEWLLDGLLGLTTNGLVNSSPGSFLTLYGYSFALSSSGSQSVFQYLLSTIYNSLPDLPSFGWNATGVSSIDRLIPSYPFLAYWKVISDWYINTAISNPDTYFLSQVCDNSLFDFNSTSNFAFIRARLMLMNEFANRYWNNDYFTSAFPSPEVGSAVGIPVNGTIVDLRNANAMQKLKERLLYAGSRFRDVLYAITGKKTSAAILEMSEVLASWSNSVNIDSVMQQSETTQNSPQAEYAGTGLGYRSGGKPFTYVAEEPTVIMIVASIVPQASYFQGIPRKLMRGSIYDYAIPQLANVGEQAIYNAELYLEHDSVGSTSSADQIFGWTRRNGDWMWTPNEVHGDFRGSLDFWHNSRIFANKPYLSTNFLSINEQQDNLSRIYAVSSPSIDHFYCRFDFDGWMVRHLPKHVHYEL